MTDDDLTPPVAPNQRTAVKETQEARAHERVESKEQLRADTQQGFDPNSLRRNDADFIDGAWERALRGRLRVLKARGVGNAGPRLEPGYHRLFLDALNRQEVLLPDGGMAAWQATRASAIGAVASEAAPRSSASMHEALAAVLQAQTSDDPEPLRIRTRAELRELANDPARLFEFMGSTLPKRLRQIQDLDSSVDSTAQVVVTALLAMVDPLRDLFGPLIPQLRGYLEQQYHNESPDKQRSYQWLSVAGTLANITPKTGILINDGSRLPIFWLDAVYSNFLPCSLVARKQAWDAQDRELLAFVLNNVVLSGEQIIEYYSQQQDFPKLPQNNVNAAREAHRRLLAAGAGFEDETNVQLQDSALASAVLKALGIPSDLDIPSGSEATFLATFDQMDKVGTAVPLERYHPARTTFRLAAGVARATSRNSQTTASAFFNAGVATFHTEVAAISARGERAITRALLNAVGLTWAIELNPSPIAALVAGDGLDCAVNLFGALAESSLAPSAPLRSPLELLFQHLTTLKEAYPFALDMTDMGKIEASAGVLNLRGTAGKEDAEGHFRETAQDLLRELARGTLEIDKPWPAAPEEAAVFTAELSSAAMRRFLSPAGYTAALSSAAEHALRFHADKQVAKETITGVYQPLLETPFARGKLGEPLYPHPTVSALGLADLDDLWVTAQNASIEPCGDLAAAVTEATGRALAMAQRR